MEVILFASLYWAKEILIFCVHFLLKNFLSTWRDRSGVPFLPYKKASSDENTEVPADLFFLSSCWVAFGRPFYLWTVLPGVPRHWRVPPASGGHPPRLIPPSGELGLLPGAWGAPKRGMPTGPKVFLALRDACGLRPCDRAHLKNGLVLYSCVGGTQR